MSNPIDLCLLADVRREMNIASGGVVSIGNLIGGSGYASISVVAVPVDGNGSGATFTGMLVGGVLLSIHIDTPGIGYTQAPTLLITGSGGSGASATTSLAEDSRLQRLITACSQNFISATSRPAFLPTSVSEKRNGNGQQTIVPYAWPILSVQSVTIQGVTLAQSPDGIKGGWVNDAYKIMVIGYQFSSFNNFSFTQGFQNIILNYTFGYPSIPFDVSQAVIEWVQQKYRRSQHVDQDSQASTDKTVISFSKDSMPKSVKDVINFYKLKAIIE